MTDAYNFSVPAPDGETFALEQYRGKVLLIVNTASQCGFTPQYEGLQALHQQFHGKGLQVLGFPCNQFGAQEPGTADEIADFCEKNYGVSFPIFSKISINGKSAHPLFNFLKSAAPGIFRIKRIHWNFTKFLIKKNGDVYKRYAPKTPPETLIEDIKKLLSE